MLASNKNFKENESEDKLITVQNLADFVDKQVELQKLRKTNLEEQHFFHLVVLQIKLDLLMKEYFLKRV